MDRAALDAAINNHIVHGGWCPRGRLAEDGRIAARYKLRETDSADYAVRTVWNVRDTDGTLILNMGQLEGGTALTLKSARNRRKPWLVIDLNQEFVLQLITDWISAHQIEILNIAGPRESKLPGIYKHAFDLLNPLFKQINTEARRTRRK